MNFGWEEEVIYSIELWDRFEEEVIHSIELWVGGGGYSRHRVVSGRRRLFTPLCWWEEEIIHSIELRVGGGGNSLH